MKKQCQKCGSEKDVAQFVMNGATVQLCVDCRGEYLGKRIDTAGWKPEN